MEWLFEHLAISFTYSVLPTEAYVSAEFPSDGKRGTSKVLHAVCGVYVRVIGQDSYFGLEIRIWVRNSHLGLGIGV